jgi:rRNA maturation endonuclease Nob1
MQRTKIEIPHCYVCGNQADIPADAKTCPLCGGKVVLGNPVISHARKVLRISRAMLLAAKENRGG